MPQAQIKAVWCLARANEPPCLLSARELLILAELGHLRGDDLLWRPGSPSKRPIRSLLGPPQPSPLPAALSGNPPQISGTAASAPTPAPDTISDEAISIAPVFGPQEQGQHRKWALAGAITGAAIVAISLAALGAAVFLQSQTTELQNAQAGTPGTALAVAGEPRPWRPSVPTEEVAVRKVKVLDIPAPPPGQ